MITTSENVFLETIIKQGAYSSKKNLKFKLDSIFGGIDFKGKNVLEIGGGIGVFCFYAAFKGAKSVINLEPEFDGSTLGVKNKFQILQKELGFNNVELQPITFQDFAPMNQKFDIIILYNSINHLNEAACINLLRNQSSMDIYKNLFNKFFTLSNHGAKMVIADCSNRNFYNSLSLKNPFAPSIEWHKHQSPRVWSKLLKESGFSNPAISWTTFNGLREFGKLMIGNSIASYFLTSHFCLKMEKE